MMNKIVLDNKKIVLNSDKANYLRIENDFDGKIIVPRNSHAKLVIVANCNANLDFYLEEDGTLLVNSLNRDNNVNVKISLEKNSGVIYNHSVLSDQGSDNNFSIYHLADNTKSIINNNGINRKKNKLYFRIDGVIPKNLHEISCNQNSKIINFMMGDAKIIPNLIIDSNDIIANHSAYVGEIEEEVKFYLASRGISDKEIEKLIYKATLLGKMELQEEQEEFNNIINEWW